MTQIVHGCESKKALKAYAQQINDGGSSEQEPFLSDPSIFNSMRGGDSIPLRDVREGEVWIVTNHPKRSWFAKVTKKDGRLRVE